MTMFSQFLASRYPPVKARFPTEGRRKWRLRVAEMFWNLSAAEKASLSQTGPSSSGSDVIDDISTDDDDPLDSVSDDSPGLGIVLRTDYSDDAAWGTFLNKLHENEAELRAYSAPPEDVQMDEDAPAINEENAAASGVDSEMNTEDEDRDDEDEDDTSPQTISVIDVPPLDRVAFQNISNLAALRLLNDVDIVAAPVPPQGTQRIKPPNRLIDHHGWQEVYTGKTLWIYDARSNIDQCARLVSPHGQAYGNATADSWRARVSSIPELQVNMSSGAMTIDFGGLDRWDFDERTRNLQEAVKPLEQ